MIDNDLSMRRVINRMDSQDQRVDWFTRHHRLAEQLLRREAGPITHPNPLRPVVDYLCADSLVEAKENGGAMWNHSAWVIDQGWQRLNLGKNEWWPRIANAEGDLDDATCPLCDDLCRYQVESTAPHYIAREEAGIPYHPWPFLIDAAQMWFFDSLPGAISPLQGEGVGSFIARHLPTFEVMSEENGGLPELYSVRLVDTLTGDVRHILYTLERVGTQFYSVRGAFKDAGSLNAWRARELGVIGAEEIEDKDITDRLSAARALLREESRAARLIKDWRAAREG